jgi:hypothetical protein
METIVDFSTPDKVTMDRDGRGMTARWYLDTEVAVGEGRKAVEMSVMFQAARTKTFVATVNAVVVEVGPYGESVALWPMDGQRFAVTGPVARFSQKGMKEAFFSALETLPMIYEARPAVQAQFAGQSRTGTL